MNTITTPLRPALRADEGNTPETPSNPSLTLARVALKSAVGGSKDSPGKGAGGDAQGQSRERKTQATKTSSAQPRVLAELSGPVAEQAFPFVPGPSSDFPISADEAHDLARRLVSHGPAGILLSSWEDLKSAFEAEGYTVTATDAQMAKVFAALGGTSGYISLDTLGGLEGFMNDGTLSVSSLTMTVGVQESPALDQSIASTIAGSALGTSIEDGPEGLHLVTPPTDAAAIRAGLEDLHFSTAGIPDEQLQFVVMAYSGTPGGQLTAAQLAQAITDGALVLGAGTASVNTAAPGLLTALAQSLAAGEGGTTLSSVDALAQALAAKGFAGLTNDPNSAALFAAYAGADGVLDANDISQMLTGGALVLTPPGTITINPTPAMQQALTAQQLAAAEGGTSLDSALSFAQALSDAGFTGDLTDEAYQNLFTTYAGADGALDAADITRMLSDGALVLSTTDMTMSASAAMQPPYDPLADYRPQADALVTAGSRDDGYLSSFELADAIRAGGYESHLTQDELQFIVNAYDGAHSGYIDSSQLAQMLADGALQLQDGEATIDAQNPQLLAAFAASLTANATTPGLIATPEELQTVLGYSGFARLPGDPALLALLFKAYAGDDGMSTDELEQMLLEGTLQLSPDFKPRMDMTTPTAVDAMTQTILGGATEVDATQLTAGLGLFGTQHLGPAQAQLLIDGYDADGSGKLNAAELSLALNEGALHVTCGTSDAPACELYLGPNEKTRGAMVAALLASGAADATGALVITPDQLVAGLGGLGFTVTASPEELTALAGRYGTGGVFKTADLLKMLQDGALSIDSGAASIHMNVLELPGGGTPGSSASAFATTASVRQASFTRRQALQEDTTATPSTAVTVEVPSAAGSYTVAVDGGFWARQAAFVAGHPELQPLIRSPELIDLSKKYVAELRSGKTLQEILGNKTPTSIQQDALEQALELLGISDRQVQIMATLAGQNHVDEFWSSPNSTGNAALAALRQAGHMRMAIDGSANWTLDDYANGAYRWNPNDLPGLSMRSFVTAIEDGCKDSDNYYYPKDAARDIFFGTGYVQGGIFGSKTTVDDYRNEGFVDGEGFRTDGVNSVKSTTLTQKDAGAFTPPSRVTAAVQAFTGGATIEDVDKALAATGIPDGHTRSIIIEDALDQLGISNEELTALAKGAQADILALGSQGVHDYLNDPNSTFDHPALDKLFAALQTRFQINGTETGEAAITDRIAGEDIVGYDAAVAAVRKAGISGATVDAMPIGVEEKDGLTAPITRTGSARTELSNYNETAAEAHADKGKEALGLTVGADQGIAADAIGEISGSLGDIFSSTDEAWTDASVTQTLNASTIVYEAIAGSASANTMMQMTRGMPRTVEGTSELNAAAINAALQARGLGNLTHEQIAKRLYSALTSQAFLDQVAAMPDSQRVDYVNSQLDLLKFFDPMLAEQASLALSDASQPGGTSLDDRRMLHVELTNQINQQSFTDQLAGDSTAQKTGVVSVFIVTLFGAIRQLLAAGGKQNELLSGRSLETMEKAVAHFAMMVPITETMSAKDVANAVATFIENTPPADLEAGGEMSAEDLAVFAEMKTALASARSLPGWADLMTGSAQTFALLAAAARTSAIAAKFTAGDYTGATSQMIGLLADGLSQAGSAVKLYKSLPDESTFKGLEYWLGGWATLDATNPVARLFKPVIELGSAYSQAAYSVQSLYAGIVNMVRGKYAKGGVLLSRSAFFLNSFLLLKKAGPYPHMAVPTALKINVANSVIIALHNALLAGLWKGE